MRKYFFLLIVLPLMTFGQSSDLNLKNGYMAKGYDVVTYFKNQALKGDNGIEAEYDGAKYKFVSLENLNEFKSNPDKYVPQFGGYCAYAIAVSSEKVDINPDTFEIRNGKLYLFYNAWGTNTLNKWLVEKPVELEQKAHENWSKIQRAEK